MAFKKCYSKNTKYFMRIQILCSLFFKFSCLVGLCCLEQCNGSFAFFHKYRKYFRPKIFQDKKVTHFFLSTYLHAKIKLFFRSWQEFLFSVKLLICTSILLLVKLQIQQSFAIRNYELKNGSIFVCTYLKKRLLVTVYLGRSSMYKRISV